MKMTTLNSLRYLCNGFLKSVVNVPCGMQCREIHLSIHPMLKSVEDKLGLPARPKRPLNGFVRFAGKIRPSQIADNPNLKANEMMALIAKKWSLLADIDKEKFNKEYDEEKLNYVTKLAKYNETLSEDDKAKINEMKAEIEERKAKLSKLKRKQGLRKPRKPRTGFLKYFSEQKDSQVKGTKAEYVEYLREFGSKWRALSDAERQKYNTSDEMETYQKALQEWEEKMIELGHHDVIRKTKKIVDVDKSSKS